MINILFEESNLSIVQLEQRKFPSIVLQGDTFNIMYQLVNDLCERTTGEAHEIAQELCRNIQQKLVVYERVLEENNIRLPYNNQHRTDGA